MRIGEKQHPDKLADKHKFYSTTRGSMQALDDLAIEKYLQAIKDGKSQEEIRRAFFETFSKSK